MPDDSDMPTEFQSGVCIAPVALPGGTEDSADGSERGPSEAVAIPTGCSPVAVGSAIESAGKPLCRCAACSSRPKSAADACRLAGSSDIASSIAVQTSSGIPLGRRSGTSVDVIRRYCAISSSPLWCSWAAVPAMSA